MLTLPTQIQNGTILKSAKVYKDYCIITKGHPKSVPKPPHYFSIFHHTLFRTCIASQIKRACMIIPKWSHYQTRTEPKPVPNTSAACQPFRQKLWTVRVSVEIQHCVQNSTLAGLHKNLQGFTELASAVLLLWTSLLFPSTPTLPTQFSRGGKKGGTVLRYNILVCKGIQKQTSGQARCLFRQEL